MDIVQRKKEPDIYRKYWQHFIIGAILLGAHIFIAYYTTGTHLDQINNARRVIEFEENKKMNDGIFSINQYLEMQSHEASFLAKQIRSLDTSEIESFCKDFMENNTEYFQLRILTEQGDETLRLFRKEGVLSVIPKEHFQNKAHRNYFKKVIELNEFEVYHSELNLDREYGKPMEPLRVTLRHYSPFIRNGEKYMVGLSWDYEKLFSSLRKRGLFLLNENQELLHGNIAELFKKTNIEELTTSLTENFLFLTKSFEVYTGQRLTIGAKRDLKEFNIYKYSEKKILWILWGGIFLSILGSFSVIYAFAKKRDKLESERKYIERIKFNAVRFERVFNISPDLVGMGSLNGYFTKINFSFKRILGYEDKEFLGRPFVEFIYEDDVESTLEVLGGAVGGRQDIICQNRYRCRDGSYKWIEWNVLAIAEEGVFYTTGRDITRRKRSEKQLEAQHEITKVLAESSTVKEAFPRILQAICVALNWDVGEIWECDQQQNVLCNTEFWHVPSRNYSKFKAVAKQTTLLRGIGLPGRVWKCTEPLWVEDVVCDADFPRSSVAEKQDLHGAFGFPIINP